jgi:hypothetical protein
MGAAHKLPGENDLVRFAADLQSALARGNLGRAREAHRAFGRELERAEGEERRVIDLAQKRAQRRPLARGGRRR